MQYQTYAEVKDGKLKIRNLEEYQKNIALLKGLVLVTIKERKKIRSLPQNSLYWKVVTVFADYVGVSAAEMHATFKGMYLKKHKTIKIANGIGIMGIIGSTTKLSTAEFKEYLDNIYRLGAEYNIDLPKPEDNENT